MLYMSIISGQTAANVARQFNRYHFQTYSSLSIHRNLQNGRFVYNKYRNSASASENFGIYCISTFEPRNSRCSDGLSGRVHLSSIRQLHQTTSNCDREPSKVEQTVKKLKEDLQKIKQETSAGSASVLEDGPSRKPLSVEVPVISQEKPIVVVPKPKKTLGQRIVAEIKHYYHGFRLLFIDIRVSSRLLWNVLNGKNLSRREHKQLVRTVSDLFRILPFSVFIIVPFLEILLPVAIKIFPNMLPSTFQHNEEKQTKMKKQLKVKLEMAKFLQDTLDEMALQSSGDKSSSNAKEFANFFQKVRQSGEQTTNEEILKFSKLFEDEITLDNMPRPQLVALCKLLELQPIGTDNFLRFQLRMRLRNLLADDKMIKMEGINSLSVDELQVACKSRGMRAVGITTQRLRSQLSQWLELSLNEKIPPSLLLLSRALYLPENLPASDQLKATISSLPESAATEAMYKIGEKEGKVHNKTKLDIIKQEEEAIKREREEALEVEKEVQKAKEKKEELAVEDFADQVTRVERKIPQITVQSLEHQDTLVDTAPILEDKAQKVEELSQEDFENLEDALDNISAEKEKLWIEKEELEDLKEDIAEYKEDIEELGDMKVLSGEPERNLRESKAASRLYNKVYKMINGLDVHIDKLEDEKVILEEEIEQQMEKGKDDFIQEKDDIVNIDELLDAMKSLQKSSDETRSKFISEILEKLDYDQDGAVKVEEVLKVIELIGKDNVKINPGQMEEIMDLLEKEESLGFAERIEKQIEREQRHQEAKATKGQQLHEDETVNVEKIIKNVEDNMLDEEKFKEQKRKAKEDKL